MDYQMLNGIDGTNFVALSHVISNEKKEGAIE